jgi:hypothetical protein
VVKFIKKGDDLHNYLIITRFYSYLLKIPPH